MAKKGEKVRDKGTAKGPALKTPKPLAKPGEGLPLPKLHAGQRAALRRRLWMLERAAAMHAISSNEERTRSALLLARQGVAAWVAAQIAGRAEG